MTVPTPAADEPPAGPITKRKVTMRAPAGFDPDGNALWHEAVDYVHADHVPAYVADAQTRWAYVGVSDEPDAGPGGYHGAYTLPPQVGHPDAGVYRPPTPGSEAERLLLESLANPSEAEPAPDDVNTTPEPPNERG